MLRRLDWGSSKISLVHVRARRFGEQHVIGKQSENLAIWGADLRSFLH